MALLSQYILIFEFKIFYHKFCIIYIGIKNHQLNIHIPIMIHSN
jgi:hypothetical protein